MFNWFKKKTVSIPTVIQETKLGPIPDTTINCITCRSKLRISTSNIHWATAKNFGGYRIRADYILCPVCEEHNTTGSVYAGYAYGPWPFLTVRGRVAGIDLERQKDYEQKQKDIEYLEAHDIRYH